MTYSRARTRTVLKERYFEEVCMVTDEPVLLTTSSPCSEIAALKSQYGFIAMLPTPSNDCAHGETEW